MKRLMSFAAKAFEILVDIFTGFAKGIVQILAGLLSIAVFLYLMSLIFDPKYSALVLAGLILLCFWALINLINKRSIQVMDHDSSNANAVISHINALKSDIAVLNQRITELEQKNSPNKRIILR